MNNNIVSVKRFSGWVSPEKEQLEINTIMPMKEQPKQFINYSYGLEKFKPMEPIKIVLPE